MRNYIKINRKLFDVDFHKMVSVKEKKNEIEITWSWWHQAIKIKTQDYAFYLLSLEELYATHKNAKLIVNSVANDDSSYHAHTYDFPSEKQFSIISENRDKINEILSKKKCPLIDPFDNVWVGSIYDTCCHVTSPRYNKPHPLTASELETFKARILITKKCY